MKEKNLFEVDQTPLFFIQASGHYREDLRTNRVGHTSVVDPANHFQRKGSTFQDAFDKVEYDAPEEVNMTHPG